jgi:hypothetical protein
MEPVNLGTHQFNHLLYADALLSLPFELKIKPKYLYSFTFSNKLFLKVKLKAGSFVGAFLLFENIII